MKSKDDYKHEFIWKWEYSMVLILNALYILIFYYIMNSNI